MSCVLIICSATAVLTSSNNSITLKNGYYENYTISTTVPTNGSITYQIGHKHVGSATAGGPCYQTVDQAKSWVCGRSISWSWEEDGVSNGQQGYYWSGWCSAGHHHRGSNAAGSPMPSYHTCGYGQTFYLMDCGLEEGEFIRDTTDINDVGTTEKLLSAKIIY